MARSIQEWQDLINELASDTRIVRMFFDDVKKNRELRNDEIENFFNLGSLLEAVRQVERSIRLPQPLSPVEVAEEQLKVKALEFLRTCGAGQPARTGSPGKAYDGAELQRKALEVLRGEVVQMTGAPVRVATTEEKLAEIAERKQPPPGRKR